MPLPDVSRELVIRTTDLRAAALLDALCRHAFGYDEQAAQAAACLDDIKAAWSARIREPWTDEELAAAWPAEFGHLDRAAVERRAFDELRLDGAIR